MLLGEIYPPDLKCPDKVEPSTLTYAEKLSIKSKAEGRRSAKDRSPSSREPRKRS